MAVQEVHRRQPVRLGVVLAGEAGGVGAQQVVQLEAAGLVLGGQVRRGEHGQGALGRGQVGVGQCGGGVGVDEAGGLQPEQPEQARRALR